MITWEEKRFLSAVAAGAKCTWQADGRNVFMCCSFPVSIYQMIPWIYSCFVLGCTSSPWRYTTGAKGNNSESEFLPANNWIYFFLFWKESVADKCGYCFRTLKQCTTCKFHLLFHYNAMLRQITESFLICSKIKELKKWMELRPHPKDCCNPIASLLGVNFHSLLRKP